MAYRPALKLPKSNGSNWPLYWRFIRQYAWNVKWRLLLCIVLIAVNANYTYVISFFARHVVDNILVIQNDPKPEPSHFARAVPSDKEPLRKPGRPEDGIGHGLSKVNLTFKRPPEAGRKLLLIAICYICTQIFFNTLWRIATRTQIVAAQTIVGRLREDMHRKVMELSMSYHQAMSPGRLLSRILSDVGAAQAEMMGLLTSGAHCFSMIIVGTTILLVNEWRLGIYVLAVIPIYTIIFKYYRGYIGYLNKEIRHTNACMYGLVTQKLDAVKAIQSYAREPGENRYFHQLAACFFRDAVRTQFMALGMGGIANLMAHLSHCALFLVGANMVLKGQITLGKLIFVESVAVTLFQPALEFSALSFVMQRLMIALQRIAGVLDQKIEIAEDPNSIPFPSPLQSGIQVKHLSFRYPEMRYEKEDDSKGSPQIPSALVLRDVSFTVKPGEWLCIMGASGAGKTTLLNLLARLYEPTRGQILIDGINLDKINIASLRHSLGVVPQEAQIFGATIRDNIAYGRKDATNSQIIAAAKAAEMHDVIMGMKVQYETVVGQKGTSLSGGQRQRLSLARALITNPEVLLLDDCTSALDANTERKIQETLETTLQGKTAIMVSQRISMAIRCSHILVLENGVVSEYGTHHELLEKNGFYAKLYAQQTGA